MNRKDTTLTISGNKLRNWLLRYAAQIAFLAILFIVLSVSSPVFLTGQNLLNVMRQVSTNVFVACAMTLILISGGIDLSIGAVMASAGMVSAYMSLAGIPFAVCLIAGLLVGALVGLINGVIIANTNMQPFIVTYATQIILRGMVYVITAAGTMRLANQAFLNFGGGRLGRIPWPIIYMIIVIIMSVLILNYSKLGRHIYAIGGNAKAAQFAGINIKRIKIFIYTLSGTLAALSGLVLTSRNSSMQPSLGVGLEMDAIAAVVLGGTSMAGGQGAIAGTIIGAFIIGFINNGLNLLRMDSFWQYIIKGIVILIAVYMDFVKNKKIVQS
ncbi:MAG: ABC transporter permease [Oscillospiraceae bacterium]|jgi:ribose transport system permease protein